MGCFFGSCLSQNAGQPAKQNGCVALQPSTPISGLNCKATAHSHDATAAGAQWACDSVSSGSEGSSSSCKTPADMSDSGYVCRDQGKAYHIKAMFSKQQRKHQPNTSTADTLYSYIVQHGSGILSLSTLQEGLQHFVVPGVGYIAFAMMHNGPEFLNVLTPVALGDPICDPSQFPAISKAFLRQFPKAMFMQVSAAFAAVLQSLGLLVNSVGGVTQLDLATYTFSGYAKRGLRSAIASAAKEHIQVAEVMQAPVAARDVATGTGAPASPGDWASIAAEMCVVDREWLLNKGKHAGRVWFLNRQPVFAPEPGVRKLTARDSTGRLLGFIFFDAVYEGGAVVGYYANVTRMRPDAHPGVLNLVVKEFIDRVRAESQLSAPAKKLSMKKSLKKKLELQQQQQQSSGGAAAAPTSMTASACSSGGIRFLSLGLSPLHHMNDSEFSHNSRARKLFEFSYNHGSSYYPFKPLAAAKAKYGAGLHDGSYEDPAVTYQQVYLAHSHKQGAAAAVALFDLAKLIGFWKSPADAAVLVLGQTVKGKMMEAKQQIKQRKQQQQQLSRSNNSKTEAGTAPAALEANACSSAKNKVNKSAIPACTTTAAAAEDYSAAVARGRVLPDGVVLHSTTSLSDTSSLIGTAVNGSPRAAASSSSSPGSSSESGSQY